MKNDNEGVGTPSGPRVLASRSLRPECYRGDLANSKILAVMSLFGFLLLRNSGLDPDSFDVAMGARLAVNEDFVLNYL